MTNNQTTRFYAPEGQVFTIEKDSEVYSVHLDALGSVRAVVDDSGTVQAILSSNAWGETLPSQSNNLPGGFHYGFIGGLQVRHDSASGLHYMRHRWYDSSLGRFLSRDPDVENLEDGCTYVGNLPTDAIDPLGLRGGPGPPAPAPAIPVVRGFQPEALEPNMNAGAIRPNPGAPRYHPGVPPLMLPNQMPRKPKRPLPSIPARIRGYDPRPRTIPPSIKLPLQMMDDQCAGSGFDWWVRSLQELCEDEREKCKEGAPRLGYPESRAIQPCDEQFDECMALARGGYHFQWNYTKL